MQVTQGEGDETDIIADFPESFPLMRKLADPVPDPLARTCLSPVASPRHKKGLRAFVVGMLAFNEFETLTTGGAPYDDMGRVYRIVIRFKM